MHCLKKINNIYIYLQLIFEIFILLLFSLNYKEIICNDIFFLGSLIGFFLLDSIIYFLFNIVTMVLFIIKKIKYKWVEVIMIIITFLFFIIIINSHIITDVLD